MRNAESFKLAQVGYANLKSAVFMFICENQDRPLSNVEIGKSLGIYGGHLGHVGHISRTMLEDLKTDGLIVQDEATKLLTLVDLVKNN